MIQPQRTTRRPGLTRTFGGFGLGSYLMANAVKKTVSSSDPSVTDDAAHGFVAPHLWLNAATTEIFVLVSDTAGAAVWRSVGASDHPGWVGDNWYPLQRSNVANNVASAADDMRAHPIFVPHPITVKALGIYVVTGAVGAHAKIGIYANDYSTGRPGAKLIDAGAVDADTNATFEASAPLATPVTLDGGLYWAASVLDGAPTVASYNASTFQSSAYYAGHPTGSLALNGTVTNAVITGITGTATYAGGLPSAFGTTGYPSAGAQACPIVALQAA